jgi:hypothetical protein
MEFAHARAKGDYMKEKACSYPQAKKLVNYPPPPPAETTSHKNLVTIGTLCLCAAILRLCR